MSEWSLARWIRQAPGPSVARAERAAVHEVSIVEPSMASGPVLVTASGVRVEGLSFPALVSLLRELS